IAWRPVGRLCGRPRAVAPTSNPATPTSPPTPVIPIAGTLVHRHSRESGNPLQTSGDAASSPAWRGRWQRWFFLCPYFYSTTASNNVARFAPARGRPRAVAPTSFSPAPSFSPTHRHSRESGNPLPNSGDAGSSPA
ncbi:MAG: hypothetical protein LBE35_02670, partial [Clostridiales bacterium]|nr:hypothetical protein [Clostridiales bacterium]